MSITVRAIIRRALLAIGAVQAGQQPDATSAADALEAFQAMVLSLPGYGLGGAWTEVDVTANYTAGENERIRITSASAVAVTLPTTVTDAISGDARPPRDGARVQIIDLYGSTNITYVYTADRGDWSQINGLTLNSNSPFGPELDEAVIAMLAVRLAPEYGAEVPVVTMGLAQDGASRIYARFKPSAVQTIDPGAPGMRRWGCR